MHTRWTAWALALVVGLAVAGGVAADEVEMDPLLELLVEQGVITLEQAKAVQAEYDLRSAAKVSESATTELVVEQVPPTQIAEVGAPAEAAPDQAQNWFERIDLKGDARLRFEEFWVDGISDNNTRQRERLRFRLGMYTDITDWMQVGFQLRTGDPLDPVSDNQSVDGGFTMKPIAVTEAYAAFTPLDWFAFRAGKFDAKKLWKVSDFQWDDDVTVEGLLQTWQRGAFSATTYQYLLEERKQGDDAYTLGGQVKGAFDLGSQHSLLVGAGYDHWANPQYVAELTLSGKLKGNRVTNLLDDDDQLISDFRIGNIFAEWKYEMAERWPIKLTAFGYHNFGAAEYQGTTYDDAYFIRLQIGDYKQKGHLAIRASRYFSQPDALFYVFTQSDTTMASDVDGYRFDLRLGWVKKSYFNFTWYHTKPASELEKVATMDRLQADYIIKF